MKERWNFVLYLVWFSYLILSAVLLFHQGFLLSRKTLNDVSECVPLSEFGCDGRENSSVQGCSDDEKIRRIVGNLGAPLVCSTKKKRVAMIMVDALRYDFTQFDPELEYPLNYQNRLPFLQETLKAWPNSTKLFRFMADPPTTTLQRVKSLATGSLPTFIDFSSNFAAMELQEDSIIDQVTKGGGGLVLLGDDTWSRLMPGKWLRSHAMYSFHTWDLDTVDNEVDSKIYDELKKNDWDLLLAHYLGVDHAGHRYGPHHPEMARKLSETNRRLKRIIEILPEDVLLYVIGDHGMTENGDHGGESKAERTAAIFAYSKSGLSNAPSEVGQEVLQTDFAPTVSAALGRPPPAPSLGGVLLPLLPTMTIPESILVLTNNLKQMCQYLVRYGEESQQIPLEKLTQLINITRDQIERASSVESEQDLHNYITQVRELIDNIRGVFREVWVEFDSLSMLRALLLLLLAIFFNWLIIEGLPTDRLPNIFASSFVPMGYLAMAFCAVLCYTAHFLELLENLEHAVILSSGLVSGVFAGALVIMHWDGITQRWHEGRAPAHERLARAALAASAAALLSNSFIIEEGPSLCFLALSVLALIAWNAGTMKALGLWVACGVALAATRPYRGCREEQGDCWTAAGGGAAGAGAGQASRASLVLALGSAAGYAALARRHAGWRGYGVLLAGVFACAHWAVGWGSLGSASRSRLLARWAWLVAACTLAALWRRDAGPAHLPLAVLGLTLYIANALAMGVSFAPAAGLALLVGFLALNLITMQKTEGTSKLSLSRVGSSGAAAWALLAAYMFYGGGHHATLSHVRWAPAFHAGDPNYLGAAAPHVTAILVAFDQFGMPLMFGATVPLLALWGGGGGGGGGAVGPRSQLAAVFTVCLKFALCFAVRVFASALSATIHCRHLMIWGVFAPKLLFESCSCAAALLGTVLGAALATRHLPHAPHRSS